MKGSVLKRFGSRSRLILLAIVIASSVISCGPSHVVGYQGRLTDASGNPINGTKSITFRLWNNATATSSSNKLFEEVRDVTVTNGLMNVDIGSSITDDANGIAGIDPGVFAQPLWLELVIDGETLAPRQKLLGAPYAMTLTGGAVIGSLHEGNGAGGSDTTDANYGALTVAAGGGGTALVIGSAGDMIRACSGLVSSRTCSDLEFRVQANGNVSADGSYATPASDFAEMIRVEPAHAYMPGDVLAISRDSDRAVVLSDQPYSHTVVGVYSTEPGFIGGGVIEETINDGSKIPVALVGIVPVKVSAENGAIQRGDLLTTASIPGHAMKATEFRVGTILGKAMGQLQAGTGIIEVLLTLQ